MSTPAGPAGLGDILRALDEGVMVWALDGRVVEVNPAAERILGVPADVLLAQPLGDERLVACDGEGRPLATRDLPVGVALRTRQSVAGQVIGVHAPSGRITWLSCNATPTRAPDGAIDGVFCAFTDVTAQRRTEAQFRAMVDRSLNVIALLDRVGTLSFVNAAAERRLGWQREDLLDRSVLDVIHPDDHARMREEFRCATADDGEARRFDLRLATAAGDWLDFEAQVTRIDLVDGTVGLQVSARDVSDQRRTEQDVRALSARLQAMLEVLPVGIAFVGAERGRAVVNPALRAIFGMAGDVLPDESPREELLRIARQVADPGAFLMRIEEIFAAGRPVYDEEIRLADGRIALRHYVPVADEHGPLGHAWLYRDVTAERSAEDELRAVRDEAVAVAGRRSDFVATMSHEIRTPLNGMLGAAELLCATELGADQRDLVAMIAYAGGGLRAIIDEILDFSRMEAGKVPVRERPFAIRDVLAEVRGVVAPSLFARPVELTTAVDAGVPAQVLADPDRVRQILLNLAGNAAKFTDAGTVALHARVAAGQLVLSVTDTGPGIAREDRDTLFVPFTQADASPTRSHGGTGLGLSITQRLVTMLGGTIDVESTVGEGSTFTVRLPLRVPERDAAPAGGAAPDVAAAPVLDDGPRIGGHVLLADDNELNRRILTRQLERLGVAVTAVDGGRAAIEAAGASAFDAILMDCRMPEVDGYVAARTIRDGDGTPNARTPIVAVTANAMAEDRERCRAAGMDAVVTKPIALDELRETLTAVLAAGEAEAPVIDEDALARMRDELMDDALLASVVERYAAELDARAAAIGAAVEAGDADRLAEAAHVLASPSAMIGLVRLGELCRELEAAAGAVGARAAFDAVAAELARASAALPELAGRLT